jgi:hypothetical protein
MIRKTLLIFLLALAAVPVGLASGSHHPSAQAQCTKLRASMGVKAFARAFTTFGGCVSKLAPIDEGNLAAANASCEAQRADPNFASTHNGQTFVQFYGSGTKDRNAFGNCVSASVKASAGVEGQATPNPARTCRAERTAMGRGAFDRLYGKNGNKRNAFGKCVSKTARLQTGLEVNAATQCRNDSTVMNSTTPNAFGKCVASTTKTLSKQHEQATVNAAKTCYAELKANGTAAFKAKYHTFGACVSQHAKTA